MSAWAERHVLAFDTETTGPDPKEARIVTWAVAAVAPDGSVTATRGGLVNPGVPIPPEAQAIHGVSSEQAEADGDMPAVALTALLACVAAARLDGVPLCAFNARFDVTVVLMELKRHAAALDVVHGDGAAVAMGRLLRETPMLDPLIMDRQARRAGGSRRLAAVAEHYGVRIDSWHEAEADAVAAGRLAFAVAPGCMRAEATAEDAHEAQVTWAASQARSLRAYFRKRREADKAAGVIEAWPAGVLWPT